MVHPLPRFRNQDEPVTGLVPSSELSEWLDYESPVEDAVVESDTDMPNKDLVHAHFLVHLVRQLCCLGQL